MSSEWGKEVLLLDSAFQCVAYQTERHNAAEKSPQPPVVPPRGGYLLLFVRFRGVGDCSERIDARAPNRVASNVPAVAGALFDECSALKIDAVAEIDAITDCAQFAEGVALHNAEGVGARGAAFYDSCRRAACEQAQGKGKANGAKRNEQKKQPIVGHRGGGFLVHVMKF